MRILQAGRAAQARRTPPTRSPWPCATCGVPPRSRAFSQAQVRRDLALGHAASNGRVPPSGAAHEQEEARMIAQLTGTVTAAGGTWVVLDLNGFGVRALCTPGDRRLRAASGQPATLATSLVVREDSLTLYGFSRGRRARRFETGAVGQRDRPQDRPGRGVGAQPGRELRAAIAAENIVRADQGARHRRQGRPEGWSSNSRTRSTRSVPVPVRPVGGAVPARRRPGLARAGQGVGAGGPRLVGQGRRPRPWRTGRTAGDAGRRARHR
jgi:hypothetical protein